FRVYLVRIATGVAKVPDDVFYSNRIERGLTLSSREVPIGSEDSFNLTLLIVPFTSGFLKARFQLRHALGQWFPGYRWNESQIRVSLNFLEKVDPGSRGFFPGNGKGRDQRR